MKQLQNKRGTTLVELIVCMVLLSILTLAAVTLIRPSAQAYRDIQLQTRAQNLADALIETIRGEVLDANGYIRFTNGATDSANLDSVFDAQTSYSDGTALEFSVYPNHVELIDKDLVPALKNSKGKDLLTQAQAEELNGYLHMRFYQQEQSVSPPCMRRTARRSPTPTPPPTRRNPTWGCTSATCTFTPAAGHRKTTPTPRASRR